MLNTLEIIKRIEIEKKMGKRKQEGKKAKYEYDSFKKFKCISNLIF